MELISRHYEDPLTSHFGIEKTRELFARKYHWPTLQTDIEAYVKECDVCITSKAVQHKPYRERQSLPVATHPWKNLSMVFVKELLFFTNWKGEIYD